MNKLSNIFGLAALVFANTMCAHVAYEYAHMECGIAHMGYSGNRELAFLYAIPHLIAVIICVVIAVKLQKKGR